MAADSAPLRGRGADAIQRKIAEFSQLRAAGNPTEIEARITASKSEIDLLLTSLANGGASCRPSAAITMGQCERRDPHNEYITESKLRVVEIPFPRWGERLPADARVTERCTLKTVVGRTEKVHGLKLWRLAVSTEKPCACFEPTGDVFVRLKMRLSFPDTPQPGWRLDVTLSWRGNNRTEFARVAAAQRQYVNPLIAAAAEGADGWRSFLRTFRELLGRDELVGEVELEWTGAKDPAPADFAAVDKITRRFVADDDATVAFSQTMQRLAEFEFPSNPQLAANRARRGLKGLLPQVLALSFGAFIDLRGGRPLSGWLVGPKTEGFHGLVWCGQSALECAYEARTKQVWRPERAPAGPRSARDKPTVLECEVMPRDGGGVDAHVFDVLQIGGASLLGRAPAERAERIDEAVELVRAACAPGARDWIHSKKPHRLPDTGSAAQDAVEAERLLRGLLATDKYPIDGLVFTHPSEKPFSKTRSYKWKPQDQNTIDFWLISVPESAWRGEFNPRHTRGEFKGTVYALFVTVNLQVFHARKLALPPNADAIYPSNEYTLALKGLNSGANASFSQRNYRPFPVLFAPPDFPTAHVFAVPRGEPGGDGEWHRKICEMRPRFFAGEREATRWAPGQVLEVRWDMVRTREDRAGIEGYYGNFITIAEENWYNNLNPFPAAALWGDIGEEGARFRQRKNPIYVAPRAFASFVRGELYNRVANPAAFCELAAGRGGDLDRVYERRPERALFVDADPAALMLLYQRVRAKSERAASGTHVALALADLGAPPADFVAHVRERLDFPAATALSCQQALPTFCGSHAELANFAAACDMLASKKDATLIFTYPDGRQIFDAVAGAPDKTLQMHEDGELKYMLRGCWRGTKFARTGQFVEVLDQNHAAPAREALVNHDEFVAVMRARGFAVTSSALFRDKLKIFSQGNAGMASNLTEHDRTFVGDFFRYTIMRRKAAA